MKYEVLDHTADLGLVIYGRDLRELFKNAAFAMFDQIAELERVEERDIFEVIQDAPNVEELLVAWLRELLFQFSVRDFLFKDFSIEDISQTHIKGTARGERIDRTRHELKKEIKAVTYHELKVEKRDGGWRSQVIFDT